MITDRSRLLHFSIKIEAPQDITIRQEAREIKNHLETEGYCLYILPSLEDTFAQPGRERPIQLSLEPQYTTPGNIPSEVEGTIPDEIDAYKRDLGALCVLNEIETRGLEGAERYLKIGIEIPSNNLVRLLRPRTVV